MTQPIERKLAAILAADIARYSRGRPSEFSPEHRCVRPIPGHAAVALAPPRWRWCRDDLAVTSRVIAIPGCTYR